jgi:hypothetical protein
MSSVRYQSIINCTFMPRTLTIEALTDTDYELLCQLADRLRLRVHEDVSPTTSLPEDQLSIQRAHFDRAFGGWKGAETAEELVEMIYSARTSSEPTWEL